LEVIVGLPEGWNPDEWVEFEERAAILEYDGGHSRKEAEGLAAEELGVSLSYCQKDNLLLVLS